MKQKIWNILLAMVVVCILGGLVQATQILDPEQNIYDFENYRPSSGYKEGQSFTAAITGTLKQIGIVIPCQVSIITVDDDGPADFNSIQLAIDSANDGDIIIVQPGLYEAINLGGKNITLTSTSPSNPDIVSNTTINGRVCFRGTEDLNCTLMGFNIAYIEGFDRSIDPDGDNHTHATIAHCLLCGNAVGCGTVIKACDGTIRNCVITDNLPAAWCISPVIDECHGLIKNCTIANNYSGIAVGDGGSTTIQNCIIFYNWDYYWPQVSVGTGGMLNISYCDVQIGLDEIYLEEPYSCVVNWGPGNIHSDPCFVRVGYWSDELEQSVPGDYCLQSMVGRWDLNLNDWVIDVNTSPCIDAGNPGSSTGSEPIPNGNRINMGAYGGTATASKSPGNWRNIADLTNDGSVNGRDFAAFASFWSDSGPELPADMDRNLVVDFIDLMILADNWLQGAGQAGLEKLALGSYYVAYENPIVPNAPGYTLPLDLNDIANYARMDSRFDLQKIASLLEQNGFGVIDDFDFGRSAPADARENFAMPYECLQNLGVPLFITADTLLHIYHIQFDETLKDVEEREFCDDIHDLTAVLLDEALALYGEYTCDLQEAALRNVAYLAVAQKLIDPNTETPAMVSNLVASELAKIDAHAGFAPSDIFIYEEDYSQYVPRGHYTRSEELKRYFRTLMWYGRMAFLLKGAENWGPMGDALISVYDAKIQTMQAVLLAKSIEQVQVGQRTGRDVWDRMYAVTAFYVGLADDLTPYEYLGAVNKVFGSSFVPTDLENEDRFFTLKVQLSLLRSPEIYGGTGNIYLTPPITPENLDEALDKTKGMRFMGQRFIPDSYMFQNLVFPQALNYTGNANPLPFTCGSNGVYLARCYPRGLDVMAILGSARAETILAAEGDTDYVDYALRFNELKAQFDAFDISDWNRNLYWSWLYALRALIDEFGEGYPNFMRTEAWQDKELNAALASWTELRHDTILYAKQSYSYGYGGHPWVTGYVEPVPEFYGQLLALTKMTRHGLSDLDALSAQAADRLVSLENILSRLLEIANKELMNQGLSSSDYAYIMGFGETLEEAIVGVEKEGVNTILVADVHTHGYEGKVVEEGVGYVDLIIVACPIPDGSIVLSAGPVFSYYEFKNPMSDRLTDEAWRELLDSPQRPDRPTWFQSFLR